MVEARSRTDALPHSDTVSSTHTTLTLTPQTRRGLSSAEAKELARRSHGRTLYLLDEPTTGLHFSDVARLVALLHQLVDRGNTVLVIEHHLDVIQSADHIVDLGPGGGASGGTIVATGSPEDIALCADSWTGAALAQRTRPR